MPILKKVIVVGKSRAVTLPKTWLELYERKLGYSIKEVSVDVNGELKIKPYIKKVVKNE